MSVWQEELAGPDTIWLIGVRGRLDQQLNPQLEELLLELLPADQVHFVVDLTEVTYINSGGLRVLVSAWRKTRQQGGNLVLCGLNTRLEEIFGMVGFDKVFKIFPARSDAHQAVLRILAQS